MTNIRHFNGTSDWITLGLGNLGFAFGPGTVAFIGTHTSAATAVDMGIFGTDPVLGPAWSLFFVHGTDATDGNKLALYTGGPSPTAGPVIVSADGLVCAATSKPTGSVVGRTYLYKYATGIGAHTNNTTVTQNSPVPTVSSRIGDDANGVDPYSGDILLVGVWDVVLTDIQKEALPLSLAAWSAVTPRGLWLLNQSSTGTSVTDLSGGGANQTALSGTSVTTNANPPDSFFGAFPAYILRRMPLGV